MEDIIQSRQRAMVKQQWLFGDRMWRVGNPFEWTDGDHQPYMQTAQNVRALLQALAMCYERYSTPEGILTTDHDQVLQYQEQTLEAVLKHFAPFLSKLPEWINYVRSTALVRTQDYCAVKTYCKQLPKNPNHLDIGPGLGSHAMYSLHALSSRYYALEAIPHMYDIQRQFLRFLAHTNGGYLDLIECENFSLSPETCAAELNDNTEHRIKHVPSWNFPLVRDGTIDLVTATWVLNELNYSGILWLMTNTIRTVREGGYVYIRDSNKLKPGRHSIPYDQVLQDYGFEQKGLLNIQNRVDFWGTPRVYQKTKTINANFEELVDRYLGKFAVVCHGGTYNQNLDTLPGKK